MASDRIKLKRRLLPKVANARQIAPRKDSVEGSENRKPVRPSSIVSASPPVSWADGSRA